MNKEFWQKKAVLITGHEGFLGSWLTKTLVEAGAVVTGIDKAAPKRVSVLDGIRDQFSAIKGNIANARKVSEVIESSQPEFVFHLAAEAIVGRAKSDPVNTFKSNIQGTWNVLEACRLSQGISAVVVASSDKAYGSHDVLPYREDAPLQGRHPYDCSKSCTDLLCQSYFESYALPVCITRCGNIYGPGDLNFSRIVPDAIRCALKGRSLVIRSNGALTRDYIYVEDIVEAYVILAEQMGRKNLAGEAFNFSNEEPQSVLEFVERIVKAVGGPAIKPTILNQAQDEIPDQYLSAEKARQILNWKSRFSIEDGLAKAIDWYRGVV